ncbi:MAG: helix-turn-helix domain-containing protein [Gemmatimonadota bacterium]
MFAAALLQGALLAPIIARLKPVNRRATQLLALLTLLFLPMLAEEFVEAADLTMRFPHVSGSSLAIDYLIAPLILLYARCITAPDQPLSRRDGLHALPFLAALIVTLPFLFQSGAHKLVLMEGPLPPSLRLVVAGKVVVAAAYLTSTIRHLVRFVRDPQEPRARDPHVVWLLRSMVALAVMAAVSLALGVLSWSGVALPIDGDTIGTVFIAGSIYIISALLIRHPIAAAAARGESVAQLITAPLRRKYETSPLTGQQKQELLDRVVLHMSTHRPYLDASLDLQTLAKLVDTRPEYLSQVLNELQGENFYEFVNSYRVREVQSRIAATIGANKTMLAIAYESGFNSKASFNRAFKRVTGHTPSDYARTQQTRSA